MGVRRNALTADSEGTPRMSFLARSRMVNFRLTPEEYNICREICFDQGFAGFQRYSRRDSLVFE
jgi:hypothetical protein